MNAKQRELAELQALAQRRLKGARANIADGMKAAKEVKKDLEWTQKRMTYVLFPVFERRLQRHSQPTFSPPEMLTAV